MKKYCTALFFSLFVSVTQGQHYGHKALWTRLAPSLTINKHWSAQGEFHYRRQSDLFVNPNNPLGAPLTTAYRVGFTYRTGQWAISCWPLAWFHSNPTLGKPADYAKPIVHEFRPSILAEWTLPLATNHSLRLRGGYEYRDYLSAPPGGRWRFRFMSRHRLTDKLYGYIWNETLWTGAPADAQNHYFEINRTNVSLGYSLHKHLTIEGGYQFTHRQRKTLVEFDEEHAMVFTVMVPF